MKKLSFVLFLLASQAALVASERTFIQIGAVYAFVFAGKEPLTALVEANEGGGWLKVTTLDNMPRRDELWINLAQVQTVSFVSDTEDTVRSQRQQDFIRGNLESIAGAIRDFRAKERRRPASMEELSQRGFKVPRPIAGEDYYSIDVNGDGPLVITMKNGIQVSVPRR